MVDSIRVLLVEDHAQLRNQMKLLLECYPGIQVVGTADNGKQAVELSGELHPDVVLMDVQMPVMDGFTATRLIREKYPDIQVVILTNGQMGERERSRQAGAGDFLLKPVPTEQIVQAIRQIYSSYHSANC